MKRAKDKQRGLTLIETLTALAIMGLVTVSILVLTGQNTRFMTVARERAYASIAADNLMVAALAEPNSLERGEDIGEVSNFGREWRYRRVVTETGIDNIVRIDLEILPSDKDQVMARATTLAVLEP